MITLMKLSVTQKYANNRVYTGRILFKEVRKVRQSKINKYKII